MDDFRVTLNIELTDRYNKAKKDLLVAANSIKALTPEEQKQLAVELFGAAYVSMLTEALKILNQNNSNL